MREKVAPRDVTLFRSTETWRAFAVRVLHAVRSLFHVRFSDERQLDVRGLRLNQMWFRVQTPLTKNLLPNPTARANWVSHSYLGEIRGNTDPNVLASLV